MPKKPSNFSAELLWAKIPPESQARILEAAWCSHCRRGVKIGAYSVREVGGDILLNGHCPVCGGEVRRHIETPERR